MRAAWRAVRRLCLQIWRNGATLGAVGPAGLLHCCTRFGGIRAPGGARKRPPSVHYPRAGGARWGEVAERRRRTLYHSSCWRKDRQERKFHVTGTPPSCSTDSDVTPVTFTGVERFLGTGIPPLPTRLLEPLQAGSAASKGAAFAPLSQLLPGAKCPRPAVPDLQIPRNSHSVQLL